MRHKTALYKRGCHCHGNITLTIGESCIFIDYTYWVLIVLIYYLLEITKYKLYAEIFFMLYLKNCCIEILCNLQ